MTALLLAATIAAVAALVYTRLPRPPMPVRQPGTPAADHAAIEAEALAQLDRGLDTRPGTDTAAYDTCEAIWNATAREGETT